MDGLHLACAHPLSGERGGPGSMTDTPSGGAASRPPLQVRHSEIQVSSLGLIHSPEVL